MAGDFRQSRLHQAWLRSDYPFLPAMVTPGDFLSPRSWRDRRHLASQIRSSTKTIDALVCLQCAIFFVARNGEAVGGQNFDSAAPALLDFTLRFFPRDEDLLFMKNEHILDAKRDSQVSPIDGAKLTNLGSIEGGYLGEDRTIWVCKSVSDGSLWIHEERTGLYKPDPADKQLQKMIDTVIKSATSETPTALQSARSSPTPTPPAQSAPASP